MNSNKVKIMHVISDLNFGGAGKYLLDICRYIDKTKFRVIAVIPTASVLKGHIEKLDGVELIEIDGIDNRSFSLRGVREINKLIGDYRPDIVHSHACLSARISAKLKGVKRIFFTRHCIQPPTSGAKYLVKKIINRLLSNKVIAVSKAIEENLIMEGERPEDIYLVYNGVEIGTKEYDIDTLKRTYGIDPQKKVVALVGRLEKVKGQENMIEVVRAMDKVVQDDIEVLFVGEGSRRKTLERLIREECLPIKLLGHIDDIDEIYELSDVVVNTSNSEALSFAVIEGFAHKKPAVAFDIEGLREVVDDGVNGYLVEYRDIGTFAKSLESLILDEEKRLELGKNGLKKVEKTFKVEETISNMESIYLGGREI